MGRFTHDPFMSIQHCHDIKDYMEWGWRYRIKVMTQICIKAVADGGNHPLTYVLFYIPVVVGCLRAKYRGYYTKLKIKRPLILFESYQ